MRMLTGFISSKFEEYENCKGSRSWRRWKSVLLFPFFQAIFPARGIIRATRTRRGSINISKESGTKGKRWTDFVNGKYSWNSIGCVSVLGAARVKIKIKRRVFFERWRREISFSSVRTDKLIPNIYIYIYIHIWSGWRRTLYAVVTALFIRDDTVRRWKTIEWPQKLVP